MQKKIQEQQNELKLHQQQTTTQYSPQAESHNIAAILTLESEPGTSSNTQESTVQQPLVVPNDLDEDKDSTRQNKKAKVSSSEATCVISSFEPTSVTPCVSHKFDIAHYIGRKLCPDEKFELLRNVYNPDATYIFPQSSFGTKNRAFQHRWIAKYLGLCYSPSADGAFCIHCVLFSDDQKQAQLVKEAFRNWKKATERFDEHFLKKKHNSGDSSTSSHKKPGTGYESHKTALLKSQEFLQRCNNVQPTVNVAMNRALEERRKKNLQVLETLVDTVLVCGRQNIALRGHRDDSRHEVGNNNTGNFKALLRYRADGGDASLQDHLTNAAKNATYTSKTKQNKLIGIIGEHIHRKIVQDCIEAGGWYSVSADEVRDIANKEQLAVTIRFVDRQNIIRRREEFPSFLDVSESTTGEHISTQILDLLPSLGLDLQKLRSHCYDGAGNMAGKVDGVGARILSVYPKALPFWCAAHQLNRCIVQACNIPSVRYMMGTAD